MFVLLFPADLLQNKTDTLKYSQACIYYWRGKLYFYTYLGDKQNHTSGFMGNVNCFKIL